MSAPPGSGNGDADATKRRRWVPPGHLPPAGVLPAASGLSRHCLLEHLLAAEPPPGQVVGRTDLSKGPAGRKEERVLGEEGAARGRPVSAPHLDVLGSQISVARSGNAVSRKSRKGRRKRDGRAQSKRRPDVSGRGASEAPSALYPNSGRPGLTVCVPAGGGRGRPCGPFPATLGSQPSLGLGWPRWVSGSPPRCEGGREPRTRRLRAPQVLTGRRGGGRGDLEELRGYLSTAARNPTPRRWQT